jgi:hypothetical protein
MKEPKEPQEPPHFTVDWFSDNIPTLTEYLLDDGRGNVPKRMLEVGTYEGRSALWFLENVLTHRHSRLFCVDNFDNQSVCFRGREVRNTDPFATLSANLKPYAGKVTICRGESGDQLRRMWVSLRLVKEVNRFDLIYIDAGRHSRNVLEDAVLSWSMLRVGGVMIMDDYTFSKDKDATCPRMGIDAFLACYAHELLLLKVGWQVFVKKIKPKRILPCRSDKFDGPKPGRKC